MLLTLATAGAALTIPAVAPAQADGRTYRDTTKITFRDATGDAPAPVDVLRGEVTLDPNTPHLFAYTRLRAKNPEASFVVLRLGERVSDTCEIRVEVVSNRVDGRLVRNPGETTLPPTASPGYDDSFVIEDDARLDLVPTCAVLDIVDSEGAVLNTVDGALTHATPGRGTLRVSYEPDAIRNLDSGEETRLAYEVASAKATVYDVTVDAVPGDPGLVLGTTHVELGTLGGEPEGPGTFDIRRLRVTASPGMHTLTLRLAGGNAATSETTVAIWGRGGPALTGRDSLAGRTFFAQQDYFLPSSDEWRTWTAYAFLDDTWVRLSLRDSRHPKPPEPYSPCTQPTATCKRYSYDARTGELQIGSDRGELHRRVLRFHEVQDHAARAARAGSTVAFVGRNLFAPSPHGPVHRADFRLVLRKDGTFSRVTDVSDLRTQVTRQHGRYRIGPDGLLVARTSNGKVLRTGLAFVLDGQGRPRPHTLGVYAFDVWFHPLKH